MNYAKTLLSYLSNVVIHCELKETIMFSSKIPK